MSRWLGIDHGTKRIGLAAGGTADGIATPLDVIPAEPLDDAIRRILKEADAYGAGGLVVGWPLNMDDSEGPQGKLAREMAGRLAAACELDVRLWDERLSSFAADRSLAGSLTRKKRKARQDAVAAAVMLQDFLSSGGPDAAPRVDEIGE
jgi:putative Holliday junction resolvase